MKSTFSSEIIISIHLYPQVFVPRFLTTTFTFSLLLQMPRSHTTPTPISKVGQHLGKLCAACDIKDQTHFNVTVAQVGHPLRGLLQFTLSLRVNRHTRRTMEEVDAALGAAKLARWLSVLLQESYGLYRTFKAAAAPSRRAPAPAGQPQLSRQVQRAFVRQGGPKIDRRSFRVQANHYLQWLDGTMQGVSCVVWLDNFFRPRYMVNPVHGYQSLSCSVLAVLHTTHIPQCPGLPPVSALQQVHRLVVRQARQSLRLLVDKVGEVNSTPLGTANIRVPLDTHRSEARSLQWLPWMVTEEKVGSQVDLIHLLTFLRKTANHTRSPLPLLVDTNIHYRILKLAYGRASVTYKVPTFLNSIPPLYGIWHAYKYAVTVTRRAFHSQLLFLRHGTIKSGEKFPVAPTLRTTEMLMGAILTIPIDMKENLKRVVQTLRVELSAALQASDLRAKARNSDDVRALARMNSDPEFLRSQARKNPGVHNAHIFQLRKRMEQAIAMELLITQYVPALFVVGHTVRNCNWDSRETGTGVRAKEVLYNCLHILLRLSGEGSHGVEYIRTILCAVMTWTSWHDRLPGCCFSEELNEAALSRLGGLCRKHPHIYTVADTWDLYCQVKPGKSIPKELSGGVPVKLSEMVISNARAFIQSNRMIVTCVPWFPVKLLVAQSSWPDDWSAPSPVLEPVDEGHLKDMCRYTLKTLLGGAQVQNPTVDTAMSATFVRRPVDEAAGCQGEIFDLLQGIRVPDNFCTVPPPAWMKEHKSVQTTPEASGSASAAKPRPVVKRSPQTGSQHFEISLPSESASSSMVP